VDARLIRVCLFSVIAVAALTLAFGATEHASGATEHASGATEHVTAATERSAAPTIVGLEIKGAIGPATSRYIVHGIEEAKNSGASVVVLQMDTPGGLDTSMRDIIRAILASTIPVVTYVAPSGARAASAGTYILYASHVAAMAPATNLGAATPVSIGGESTPAPVPTSAPTPAPTPAPTSPPRAENPQPATALERKAVNDAVAYIRGLAELRGRNADWAEQAVRGAASLPATSALKEKVIDLIARDLPDLLAQLDGREVKIADRTVKLATRDATVVWNKPDWRTELLAVITNPTIAYGLLLIGIYGLLLEGYNPGAVLPGVVGVISLVLALFALQILSVNYAGLALVALGIGMIVAEFHVHSFGSLGLGGLIAFVIGSLILFDTDVPGMAIGLPLIGGVATVGGLLMIAIVWLAARSRRHRVVTGVQGMVGQTAETMGGFTGKGIVRYGGELWKAHSELPLQAGQVVRITKVEGLAVWVEPL
jgi:membrane-bound serine protease (ClpP class)